MKVLLLAALLVTSLPTFAADTAQSTTAVAPPRGPGHDWPGHGRRDPRPLPPRRPMPPHRDRFTCTAQDRIRRSYRGEGWNLNDARRDALRSCQSRSIVRGCQVVDCNRH